MQKKKGLHNWDGPKSKWQRIHIDFAGPFMGHVFLLVIDAKFKWPGMYAMKKLPDTTSTFIILEEYLSDKYCLRF